MASTPPATPQAPIEGAPDPQAPVPFVQQGGGVTRVTLPGDQGAQEALNAKEGNPSAAPEEAPKPQTGGLPDGFKDWETYAKSLEAGSKPAPGEAAKPVTEEKPAGDYTRPPHVQQALEQLPEASREKAAPFFDEVARTGEMSPETRKAAAEAFGVSEAMVDAYVAGSKAQADAQVATVVAPIYEAAGGEQTFKDFTQWAITGGMTVEEQNAFDAKLDGPNAVNEVRKAVEAWKAGGNGPAPRDVTRGGGTPPAFKDGDGYTSSDQMVKAMQDRRYGKDAAYTKEVEDRTKRSTF